MTQTGQFSSFYLCFMRSLFGGKPLGWPMVAIFVESTGRVIDVVGLLGFFWAKFLRFSGLLLEMFFWPASPHVPGRTWTFNLGLFGFGPASLTLRPFWAFHLLDLLVP